MRDLLAVVTPASLVLVDELGKVRAPISRRDAGMNGAVHSCSRQARAHRSGGAPRLCW